MSTYNRRTFLKTSGALLGGIAAGTTVTAAERTDRFLVRTRGTAAPRDLEVVHEMPELDVAVVRGSEKAVRKSQRVKDYAPDIEIQLDLPITEPRPASSPSPTDEPFYPLQWDKQIQQIPEIHEMTQGGDTRVTVIDTGIDETHPEFQESLNVGLSENFTEDGGDHNPQGLQYHGTHVGGIVAADDNEAGVIGNAPATDLVDCRVFGESGGAAFGDIFDAIRYSAMIGADAANLSLGAYPIPRQGLGSFYGKYVNTVMTYANKEGTLLVIAAGNDSADLQHDKNVISLPNEGAQAVSVSATTSIGFDPFSDEEENPGYAPASYTNYGTNAITVGAPGGDVPAGGGVPDLVYNAIPVKVAEAFGFEVPYAYLAGTSMAAPQVAGAAALVKSVNPNYNANQVESALKRAADVPEGYDKTYYGSGFLNILDAL
jgi:subtilisin family serine protease